MNGTGQQADAPSVLVRTEGRTGRIVLNRPQALNALNHDMVRLIDRALTAWEHDPAVETVVVTGAGDRGLCAGGDIRVVHDDARDGDGTASAAFWRDEYHLNARIARYPKPYVAVMDGIVMGGGVGVSAHGSVRVVTERSRIAMPETGIGFVPDVGGTRLLAHAPGELGTHLALTGAPVGAGRRPAVRPRRPLRPVRRPRDLPRRPRGPAGAGGGGPALPARPARGTRRPPGLDRRLLFGRHRRGDPAPAGDLRRTRRQGRGADPPAPSRPPP